jgi:hypothetical protein
MQPTPQRVVCHRGIPDKGLKSTLKWTMEQKRFYAYMDMTIVAQHPTSQPVQGA